MGNGQALTAAEREAAYARARDDLREHYRKSGYSESQLKAALPVLEQAIEALRGEFKGSSSLADRMIVRIGMMWSAIDTKYKALIGAITLVSDFLKPLFEFTSAMAVVSGVGLAALAAILRIARESRANLSAATSACALIFVCSGGMWAFQNVIPGAKANGVIAEVVPGAGTFQNAMLASLGRIEGQTKRIGDILEDSSRRDREDREESDRVQRRLQEADRQEKEEKKRRIADAGYTLDANGLVKAIGDNYRYWYEFETFGVKPTEAALLQALQKMPRDQAGMVLAYIHTKRDDFAFVRKIHSALASDAEKIAAAYRNSGAREFLCDKKNYGIVLDEGALNTVCAETGFKFAQNYSSYSSIYYVVRPEKALPIHERYFMQNARQELPLVTHGGLLKSRNMKECGYYEGEWEYFWTGAPRSPVASMQDLSNPDSMTFFDVAEDSDFFKMAQGQDCPMREVLQRRTPQCRMRVIMSTCDNRNVTIVKALAKSTGRPIAPENAAVPPASPPAQTAAAPPPSNGALSAADIRTQIIGKMIDHAGKVQFVFFPNGRYDSGDGRIGRNGTYRIENDGRVCWKDNFADGCFTYYRAGNTMRVRRNDPKSRDEIGVVTITNR